VLFMKRALWFTRLREPVCSEELRLHVISITRCTSFGGEIQVGVFGRSPPR
jgi:hypothetical protein